MHCSNDRVFFFDMLCARRNVFLAYQIKRSQSKCMQSSLQFKLQCIIMICKCSGFYSTWSGSGKTAKILHSNETHGHRKWIERSKNRNSWSATKNKRRRNMWIRLAKVGLEVTASLHTLHRPLIFLDCLLECQTVQSGKNGHLLHFFHFFRWIGWHSMFHRGCMSFEKKNVMVWK